MKEKKPGRYQRILARADKKRPFYVKELLGGILRDNEESFILNLKVLTPNNGTMTFSWSEKETKAKA